MLSIVSELLRVFRHDFSDMLNLDFGPSGLETAA